MCVRCFIIANLLWIAFGNQDVKVVLPADVASDKNPAAYYLHVASLYKQSGWRAGVAEFTKKAISAAEGRLDELRLSQLWQTVFTNSAAVGLSDAAYMAITSIPKITMYIGVLANSGLVGETAFEFS